MATFHSAFRLLRVLTGSCLLISLPAYASDDFFQPIEPPQNDPAKGQKARNTNSPDTKTGGATALDSKAYVLQTLKYGWQSPPAAGGFQRNQPEFSQVKTTLFWQGRGALGERTSWQLSARGENEWYFWEADDPRWKSHNSELRLRDAFVDMTFDKLWLRAGQQILAWGQSEGLVITDVLSPQDLREPGQAELQDIREQVPALLGSLAVGSATKLSVAITYTADSNRYAEAQEPFDFFARYRLEGLQIQQRKPQSDWEYAIKLDRTFNGGDLMLMAGRVNDNSLSLAGLDLPAGVLYLNQQRQTVLGARLERVRGNWLVTTELAHWQDVPQPTAGFTPWPLHDQSRAMAGIEYSGWDDLSLGLEINRVHTESQSAQRAGDATETGYVARVRYTALNQRVIQQLRLFKLASEDAYISRWDISLDWSDQWAFTCALIAYRVRNDASLFHGLRNHDSINVTAKYSF